MRKLARITVALFLLVAAFFLFACTTSTRETVEIRLESDPAEAPLTITPSARIRAGDAVTIEAGALAGHLFRRFEDAESGEILGETDTYTFTATAAKTIRAVYAEAVNINLESSLAGVDPLIEPAATVVKGSQVTITAPEHEEFVFYRWLTSSGEPFSKDRETTFTATKDMVLRAEYLSRSVHEEIEAFTGDLAAVETILAALAAANATSRDVRILLETDEGETALRLYQASEARRLSKHAGMIIELESAYDRLPSALFHMVTVETTFASSLYLNAGFLWNLALSETDADIRELFSLTSDNVLLSPLPKNIDPLVNEIFTLFLATLAFFESDSETPSFLVDEWERFAFLIDATYLEELPGVDIAIVPCGEEEVVLVATLAPAAILQVIDDIHATLEEIFAEKDESFMTKEEFEETDLFAKITTALDAAAPLRIEFRYDPLAQDTLVVFSDLGFLQEILFPGEGGLTLEVTFTNEAAFGTFPDPVDMEKLMSEALMYALAAETRRIAAEILLRDDRDEGVYTLAMLAEEDVASVLPLFDEELSTIEISAAGGVVFDFYHLSNKKPVFKEPFTAAELLATIPLYPEFPESREDFLFATANVKKENIDVFGTLFAMWDHFFIDFMD